MDMKKPGPGVLHKIFSASAIDPKDDWDDRHEKCRTMLSNIMADKSAKEAHDALSSAVSKDPITHEEICIGFTVAILTSGPPGTPEGNEMASRYYRDLSLVARDGLQCVYRHMADLALDRYPKLAMGAKQQLLWLTREMVQNQVQGMDQICWNLMRQIAGGDTSPTNLWLADSLLDIFSKHRSWLDKFPFLVASVVYTYLRLIEDHFQPQLEKLREKEVKFVVALLRDRFNDVIIIGRDLVRVLQNIARIPDIEAVWKDILHNPKALSPTFGGLVMLMQSRTSRRFLQSRITPEMEKKLVFLTSQVRFGVHKRYQDWFQRQYLSTPESQSLRCDLIRFIVGVIHPTNELLGSDIIPRWAVIGWLLTTCTNQVAASNAKLALFYDWLFFDPEKDNIMNIEPAILVMHHSMKPHPAITATLLDFLCRIVGNFYPREYERVRAGIYNSLRQILDKRVLPSLAPLFDNPRLDRELRMMLRERFAIFVGKEGEMEDGGSSDVMVVHADDLVVGIEDGGPRFSDDEEDEKPEHNRLDSDEDDDEKKLVIENSDVTNKSKTKKDRQQKGRNSNNRRTSGSATTDNADDDADVLDEDAEILLKNLRLQEDCESRCEVMEQLVKHITSEDFSYDQCSLAASHLSEILQEQFEGRIFPSDPTPESIEDSIGKPLFVAFRALVEMSDSDPHRCHILQLLAELYALQPRVGYYLLYFMNADRQVRRDPKAKANVYRDLCEKIDSKFSLDICLVNDMRQCQEDDVNLFVYLIPEVYTNFPKASIGNVDLLYLVVSCVDGRQICSLVCHILAKDFIIFKKDCYQDVLRSSLTWETFEQYALWQLLGAHDLPLDCVLPLVPNFSSEKHSEALTAVLLLLKQEKPTADILKHLMAREVSANDRFVSSAITYWMNEYEDKLGELISNHLFKQTSGGSYKRKRNQPPAATGKGGVTPLPHSAELVLGHLDMLRQTCKKYEFFNQKRIQSALQQVRHLCTESQKKKFMDLFALADSDSEDEAPMQKSSQKGRTSGTGSGSGGGGGHNKANAKSPAKSKLASNKKNNSSASSISSLATSSTSFQTAGKVVSDSSTESSGESEEDKPVSRGRGGHGGRGGGSRPGGGGSKSLKRAAGRISYKMESTDESSDEDDVLASKKTPKKRKKVSPSDSE